ncbi:MAG: molybdopterin-guanine dinucleotide biosynthesis protein B [Dehalococcoidales bacterium]|nr:molybdopterin-guanine dinucleotide biosynthesis protein B [Dehalococcoidales bacterium]
MPPIISIVGKSNSGKTTLVEGLILELKSRGYRVGTIKHTPQEVQFDEPNKDSWRHIHAGSDATAINSAGQVVLIKPVNADITLDEIVRSFGEDYDIILAEGFKQDNAPKIEVHRREIASPLSNIKKIIAIATDEPLETDTRQFSLQDVKGITDFIESGFIKPQIERMSLYVNNALIPLSAFPRDFMFNVLLAMIATLKGVGDVQSIDLSIRKEPK